MPLFVCLGIKERGLPTGRKMSPTFFLNQLCSLNCPMDSRIMMLARLTLLLWIAF